MTAADAIARLAHRLNAEVARDRLQQARFRLEAEASLPREQANGQSDADWFEEGARFADVADLTREADLIEALRWYVGLDAWYAPFCIPGASKTAEQLADSGWLLRHGRLNRNPAFGSIIPKRAAWARVIDPDEDIDRVSGRCCASPDIVNAIGAYVSFLPSTLLADDPDGGPRRPVQARLLPLGITGGAWPDGDQIRLGFAPLSEAASDITLTCVSQADGRTGYEIDLAERMARIRTVLGRLRAEGAQIVIFPEMTVANRDLTKLQDLVRDQAIGSTIRLVIAGVVTPSSGRGFGRNHVVVLDGLGDEIHSHDKLARWDLRKHERDWFGVAPSLAPGEVLYENIAMGKRIDIVEIPGLGRVVLLICADMNAAEPWDWIRRNLMLDWTFAPIMDSTMTLARWIGKDCERAARLGRSRVVVTNSASLQALKRALDPAGNPGAETGVALLMDGRRAPMTFVTHDMPLDSAADWLKVIRWCDQSWRPVPPPWADDWRDRRVEACRRCSWFQDPAA